MKQRVTFSQWHKAGALALAALLASCSGNHAAAPTTDQVEGQDLAATMAKYKDQGITGSDVKGNTLQVSADAEKWSELDEDTEAALKQRMLDAWQQTWRKHHSGAHATLVVRFQNYYGEEIAKVSKAV